MDPTLSTDRVLLPLPRLARRLGVPAYWLRRQADAGQLPHVRAGAARLFDAELVERLLLERARSTAAAPPATPQPRREAEEARDARSA